MTQQQEKVLNPKSQKPLRQKLRNVTSAIERILWSKLRNQQLGVKFRRQQGIGKYIVDFYCAEAKLVIEVDGDSHYQLGAQDYDQVRDDFMRMHGLQVLRFTNLDVMNNLDAVVLVIFGAIKAKA